ncbi:MAG: Asp-tRNA(Asn)/Glu-tRNA(Gln) amidotransferase subunit GatC, partial [Mariprofundaceae bacterium]|nr:Asp-tRNA(Asn)/Glu-tRNA(Gln) amidotransferase subunit GatC [Mariprofundaceae bacterium]
MLARIRLTDDEATELAPQLNEILGYVDQLSAVNTDG